MNGYAAIQPYCTINNGVSSFAGDLVDVFSRVVYETERSEVLFGDKSVVISKIWELYFNCSSANRDESGTEPVSLSAAETAQNFIKALPRGMPLPEVAVEPDGNIALDWIQSRTQILSLSVGKSNRLAYAWLNGANSGRGVVVFNGDVVSGTILEAINGIQPFIKQYVPCA